MNMKEKNEFIKFILPDGLDCDMYLEYLKWQSLFFDASNSYQHTAEKIDSYNLILIRDHITPTIKRLYFNNIVNN